MAALENLDSLAVVEWYGNCEFIFFNYVGYGAYKELTGRNIYQDCTSEILKDNLGQRLRFTIK